jgi:urease accessory protein
MEARALLTVLQIGDSLFPSGAYSHSYGLETLVADGEAHLPEDLADILDTTLGRRLATADLPALLAAHEIAARLPIDIAALVAVDRRLTATKLADEERSSSESVGRRICEESLRLVPASEAAAAYGAAVASGVAPGNAVVALAVLTAASEVGAQEAALLACYTTCSGLLSAAMRLGRVGHGSVQALLAAARPQMLAAVAKAATVPWTEIAASCPQLDIAMVRHELAPARMFAS